MLGTVTDFIARYNSQCCALAACRLCNTRWFAVRGKYVLNSAAHNKARAQGTGSKQMMVIRVACLPCAWLVSMYCITSPHPFVSSPNSCRLQQNSAKSNMEQMLNSNLSHNQRFLHCIGILYAIRGLLNCIPLSERASNPSWSIAGSRQNFCFYGKANSITPKDPFRTYHHVPVHMKRHPRVLGRYTKMCTMIALNYKSS